MINMVQQIERIRNKFEVHRRQLCILQIISFIEFDRTSAQMDPSESDKRRRSVC